MIDSTIRRIGIAGDWHHNTDWAVKSLYALHKRGITNILHLGDFGIWPGLAGEEYVNAVQKALYDFDQTIYVTPGNHEDFGQIYSKEPDPTSGLIYFTDNIVILPRGYRWKWFNKTLVSLGGANSIDFSMRIQGKSWWKEETISLNDVKNTVREGYADIMLAHEAPFGAPVPIPSGVSWDEEALDYAFKSRNIMRTAIDGVKPRLFFHGHYHVYYDKTVDLVDSTSHTEYHTRFVGMDRDRNGNNIGILDLADLRLEML